MTTEELKIIISAETSKFDTALNGAKSSVGKIAKTAGKVAIGAVGAVAGAVGVISKKALDNYAQYEQLAGGVEKLFGSASATVIKNSQKAYKTAGLSANQYMETVTGFSASLIQSVGGDTEKASKIADMAIRDMSDNANTFGTDIQSIQNAYQGFAKQNYTMLDNLKLGYGGTKSEMERLLKDAEEISGIHYDISNLDDVYNAIHIIQEETHITGTTAKEASKTIEGSVNAMSASWQNWLTGLGDNDADMGKLTKDLAGSFGDVARNVIPRVAKICVELIRSLPTVAKTLKAEVKKVAPEIWKATKEVLPKGWSENLEKLKNMFGKVAGFLEKHGISIVQAIGAITTAILGMKVLKPIIGMFGGAKGIVSKVLGIGGEEGEDGGGGGSFKDSIKNTLKGIANVALIIGAMSVLVLAYGALSKIPGFNKLMGDGINQLKKLLDGIASMCSVQMAVLVAGVTALGFVGVQTVAMGLAGLATIIASLTVLVMEYGALSKISGFKEFLQSGIKTLSLLFNGIGQIGGSLVAGFTETAFDGLDEIGKNLSKFAVSATPFFNKMKDIKGVDVSGFTGMIASLAGADLVNKIEQMLGLGEMDLGGIGKQLTQFATSVKPFFEKMKGVDSGTVESATKALSILDSTKGYNLKSGGLAQLITGGVDLAGMGKQLASFADNVKPFFTKVASISDDGISKGKKVIIELGSSYFQKLSANGGLNFATFGPQLAGLAPHIVSFYSSIAKVSEDGIERGKKVIKALGSSSFNTIAEKAGINLTSFGKQLANLAPNISKFYSKMSNINTEVNIPAIIKPITSLITKMNKKTGQLKSAISKMNRAGKVKLSGLTSNFGKARTSVSRAVDKMKSSVSKASSGVNKAMSSMGEKAKKSASSMRSGVSKSFSTMASNASKAIKKVNGLKLKNKSATARLYVKYTTASPTFSQHSSPDGKSKAYSIGYNTDVTTAATGGITNGLNLLAYGEAGREAILPLDRNTGWMDMLAERITPDVVVDGGGGVGDATINITVELDGDTIAESVIESLNQEMDETGEITLAI